MKALKLYFQKINFYLPIAASERKRLLTPLYVSLQEYVCDHPNCTYKDLVQQFGSPKDVIFGIFSSAPELAVDIAKKKKYIFLFTTIISFVLTTIIILLISFLFKEQLYETIYMEMTIEYLIHLIFPS